MRRAAAFTTAGHEVGGVIELVGPYRAAGRDGCVREELAATIRPGR
jgi:hypothetical protein